MPFLPPNQQCQSTEGTHGARTKYIKTKKNIITDTVHHVHTQLQTRLAANNKKLPQSLKHTQKLKYEGITGITIVPKINALLDH